MLINHSFRFAGGTPWPSVSNQEPSAAVIGKRIEKAQEGTSTEANPYSFLVFVCEERILLSNLLAEQLLQFVRTYFLFGGKTLFEYLSLNKLRQSTQRLLAAT